MAQSSKLRVMISSRCNDRFSSDESPSLTDIRRELKSEIEEMEIAGEKAFEVWINEEASPQEGGRDSWEVCLQAVKDCDILLVISNGNAGWAIRGRDVGICHAELMTGLSTAPSKVRLIALNNVYTGDDEAGNRNRRFQNYVSNQNLFRGGQISTVADLKTRVQEALHDAVITLAKTGVTYASKSKFYSGTALDWTRMDFVTRQGVMLRVLRDALLSLKDSQEVSGKVLIAMDGKKILVEPHAIPAAFSVGPAKELVGQPFLRDYLFDSFLKKKLGGPLHIIACQKTVSEIQAAKFLGFPDATLVPAPFGIFVADPIQKVQFVFITNCRDETNTRHGLQRFMDWLIQTGEDKMLSDRAQSRARIVHAIAKELKTQSDSEPL